MALPILHKVFEGWLGGARLGKDRQCVFLLSGAQQINAG